MLETLNGKLSADAFVQRINALKQDPRLSLAALAGVAAVLAIAVGLWLWRDQGAFHPLYGAGEAFPAADVMQVLDAESIPYRLHPQSGQVLVREDQLGRARMLLTAKGVRVAVPAGYELFDKDEPLGTSQFVQDVRLKRSLEGELARTIMTLRGVDLARVHLALQENSSFVISKRDPAKASVMLQLAPGVKLAPEQVGAIVDLVANSVPQLGKQHISVVDQHGVLLSRGLHNSNGPTQDWQVVDGYQAKATANVEEVLAPVLGSGNFRISVTADIDFSQREETLQSFGEQPRLRNEILRDESVLDRLALGVPGSLSNRPPPKPPTTDANAGAAQGAESDDKASTSLRKESNRQLEYDQSVTHVKHAPFTLRRQSIAVVLNASAAPEGGWTPEARADLEATVKSAVGFNATRGDTLTLSVFPFAGAAAAPDALAWWEKSQVQDLAKLGVFGLISLLVLLFVVRPVVRNLLQSRQQVAAVPQHAQTVVFGGERAEHQPGLASETSEGANILGELNPLSEIRLPAPGSGLELQIEHLQMLAKNDPERVSEVLKQWIGRNERNVTAAS